MNQDQTQFTTGDRILNTSFDRDFQTLIFQPMGFDGQSLQRPKAGALNLVMEYDGSSNPIYLGTSAPGTTTATAKWQIKKLAYDGSGNLTSIKYAGGAPDFSNVWDDRAGLTYI